MLSVCFHFHFLNIQKSTHNHSSPDLNEPTLYRVSVSVFFHI